MTAPASAARVDDQRFEATVAGPLGLATGTATPAQFSVGASLTSDAINLGGVTFDLATPLAAGQFVDFVITGTTGTGVYGLDYSNAQSQETGITQPLNCSGATTPGATATCAVPADAVSLTVYVFQDFDVKVVAQLFHVDP